MREIPEGFVRSYGDVSPGAPRFAGSVLFEADEPDLPWWRVVRADGSLAKGARQKRHLLAEGVPFRGERVDMARGRGSDDSPLSPQPRSISRWTSSSVIRLSGP